MWCYFPAALCSMQQGAASHRRERVAVPAVLPSAGHYPTHPRRDTSLPNSPALFEGGVGPSGPGAKKIWKREQVVVLVVGWFPLAVSSVLTVVFCYGGGTALLSPCTTLCQQEVLTCEIKCNVCLKCLNKDKCFLLEHSLCLRMGSCEHQYFHFHVSVEQNK